MLGKRLFLHIHQNSLNQGGKIMTEYLVTGLVELDFSFFEKKFLGTIDTGSSKDCSTGTCD